MINAINGVHYGLKSRIHLFAHFITLSCYLHNTDLPEDIEYVCQVYSLERVSIIFRFGQRSQIFYTAPIYGAVCFQLMHLPCDDGENH